jgi:hypothetical protein
MRERGLPTKINRKCRIMSLEYEKGGEFMNMKLFLIVSILIGAAAILPIHTYAQDNRGNDHASEKAEVHTDAVEKGKKIEKPIFAPEKQSDQHRQVKNPGPPQKLPEKTQILKVDKRPEKILAPGTNQRTEAQKNRGVKAASMDKGKADKGEVQEPSPSREAIPKATGEPPTAEKQMVKGADEKLSNAVSKEVESPPVKKNTSPRPHVQKPIQKPVHPSPSKKQPADVEIIHTSPHRNQPPGGKPQDPPGAGAGATLFMAGGFEWETGIYLGNIYHDSEVQYWYQWMNAPPSPPPEEPPFLTV